ncbi:error-prone DNA polymerase [uncultured Roseibium sp.]|uniref:error-prone DNA polymerase n=1 Tax=uncultured Roseibium sp. TaxID=1936171 RepID=UPI002629B99D|nr:error-prone DNA polymerase [uncultured Roseibium sp.]
MSSLPSPDTFRVEPVRYAELCVTSNFTFLTGASHPEELVTRAAALGLEAIAITDRNSLAGVVRAFSALKEIKRAAAEEGVPVRSHAQTDPSSRQVTTAAPPLPLALPAPQDPAGTVSETDTSAAGAATSATTLRAASKSVPLRLPRLIVGARLVLRDSPVEWVALPSDRAAYERLSQLLTLGKRRAEKGDCHLDFADLVNAAAGLILIALPQVSGPAMALCETAKDHIRRLREAVPGHVFLGAAPRYDGSDQAWFRACARAAHSLAAPMVAVGDVLMHHAGRRRLADVLTCLREGCSIDQIGTRALPNGERRLKSPADMARLYRHHPAALRRSIEIATRCSFDLSELSYEYPDEVTGSESPQERLERLTREGLERRYPQGVPASAEALAQKELALIRKLKFAAYFLTVHDIIQFARSRRILCQGRGSAANSIICYALGITDVGPETITMVSERFISEHRGEPPDIDVDFEHERREEVIQYIYERYGRHRAGLCATVIHFRSRAATREVGKVMGLNADVTAALTGQIWGSSNTGPEETRVKEIGLDLTNPRVIQTIELIREIIGFPRHLSQHVGGFVITQGRLDALCPIENAAMENRTVIEWDKDDIDALGILKVDVLSLGMLTCIRKCFDLLKDHHDRELTLASVPQHDTPTYNMLCVADAVGVFQVESRAQMNFLPRMRPREFYDLVIEVAIVRPGPIQGGMVHPYINRRQGREDVVFPSKELEEVLGKTLGVPLFQEQAMQIAVVAAGFTPSEADKLRRSMATFRRMGTIGQLKEKFITGMLERGYQLEFAQNCFGQIEGFGEYGFPESHAAAFAMLAYVSAYLKCHFPAEFACALLNSQPMGFYAPAQIVRDARDHQVEVRPVCVNTSSWDCTLERRGDGALALRLGFRQIKGLREEDASWIVAARGNGYPDPESLWLRTGVAPATLERLAEADAFAGMGLSRRAALWQVKTIRSPKPLPLFNDPIDGEAIFEPQVTLPAMHLGQEVVEDYLSTRLTLRAHPMELLRPHIAQLTPHDRLAVLSPREARRVSVCGLVITRQRPGTASGVIFLTLEDETGVSNVVVWPKIYEKYRPTVLGGRLVKVTGRLEREGQVVHLIADTIEDRSGDLSLLGHPNGDVLGQTTAKTDDVPAHMKPQPAPKPRAMHPRDQAKRLFPSRDFH